MAIEITSLIKGIPDWDQILASNDQILASAIDEISNKIGILPVDGGTFFENYIDWSNDGGTF